MKDDSDCIFCKIVKGEMKCDKVYEDKKILAFLDINYVNQGHTLIIPKEHHKMMVDVPDKLISYMFVKAKELIVKIKNVMGADYVALSVIGTDVPHFHIHLVPRYFNDGMTNLWPTKKYGKRESELLARKIREN